MQEWRGFPRWAVGQPPRLVSDDYLQHKERWVAEVFSRGGPLFHSANRIAHEAVRNDRLRCDIAYDYSSSPKLRYFLLTEANALEYLL